LLVVDLLGEILETNILVAHTFGHDAVIEGDVGMAAALLANLKSLRRFIAHVEAFRITFGGEEYMIFDPGIHGLGEGWIESDVRLPVVELAGARILEPVFRRLHGIERNFSRATL
jgi:hypothetical protein